MLKNIVNGFEEMMNSILKAFNESMSDPYAGWNEGEELLMLNDVRCGIRRWILPENGRMETYALFFLHRIFLT